MFWKKRDPEKDRYYCLPGMGRSNRRHHQQMFFWSVVFGVFVSGVIGVVIYFVNRP
jgi:hypothetical protein